MRQSDRERSFTIDEVSHRVPAAAPSSQSPREPGAATQRLPEVQHGSEQSAVEIMPTLRVESEEEMIEWNTIAAMLGAAYLWGWMVNDTESLVSPIFNRVRLWAEANGRVLLFHKFECRVCAGFEASVVALLLAGAPSLGASLVWLAIANGAHRAIRDLIGDEE